MLGAGGRPAVRCATDRAVRRCAGRLRPGALTPVLCGSAITGAGVCRCCADPWHDLLPRVRDAGGPAGRHGLRRRPRRATAGGPGCGCGPGSCRSGTGCASPGRRPPAVDRGRRQRAGRCPASAGRRRAGQIAALRGPSARIGDTVGRPPRAACHRFPPATRQALVEPVDPAQRGWRCSPGLTELADEDPLIDLRLDEIERRGGRQPARRGAEGGARRPARGAVRRRACGSRRPRRPASNGSSAPARRATGSGQRGNPYLAGLGLRVEAAPVGHGVEFSPRRSSAATCRRRSSRPPRRAYGPALRQGPHGWEVTDCVVTMTASAYYPRQSRPHQKFDKSISTVAGRLPPPRARWCSTAALRRGRHPGVPAGRPVRAGPARVARTRRSPRCSAGSGPPCWRPRPPAASPGWSDTCRQRSFPTSPGGSRTSPAVKACW